MDLGLIINDERRNVRKCVGMKMIWKSTYSMSSTRDKAIVITKQSVRLDGPTGTHRNCKVQGFGSS
jgi:hypothetical protein